MTRICKKCSIEKDISEYYAHKDSAGGYRPICKKCNSAYNRRYDNTKHNGKTCKLCGVELIGRQNVFCSDGCRLGYVKAKNIRKCEACGKEFHGRKYKGINQRFCSLACFRWPQGKQYNDNLARPFVDIAGKDVNISEAMGVCGIYRIRNKINGKVYIGQSRNIGRRLYGHMQASRNEKDHRFQNPIYKAIRKYGADNFVFEIIHRCDQIVMQFEIDELEKDYIRKHNSASPKHGYNATTGGDGGILTDQTIEKIKASLNRPGAKEARSLRRKEWWIKNGDKRRAELAERKRNKPKESTYTPKKSAYIKKGKKDTRKVCCVERQCTFDSMTDASTVCSTRASTVWKVCNGKQETAGGLHFHWLDGEPVVFNRRPRVQTPITKEQRMAFIERSIARGEAKKIICIDTGVVYRSCGEAALILDVDASKIRKNIYDRKKQTSVKGLHFKFLEAV